MREIKFRVWSKLSNKIYYQLSESPCFGLFEGDRAVSIEDVFFYEKQDFEVMQYTGLKDKKGKEIYEGDIVKSLMQESRGEWNDFERTGVVTYFENYAQFLIKTDDNSLGCDLFQFDDTDFYEVLELEVIGNIYENPELLEGANNE
jgi:uncharacterized phage protein (TIGR01671 family)